MNTNLIRTWAAVSAAVLALAACGGGEDDDAPPARGTIVTAQLVGQATAAQIDAGTNASGLQPLSGLAKCGVDVRYVLYITRDPAGQPQTASAGVLVPSGTHADCTGNRPVVLYAHGTTTTKSKNMANISADSEASMMAAMYAAQGFIVVAPNYLGYDRSSLQYHPYLNAEAQAVDMIDGLRAAKTHLNAAGTVKPSAQLLITGYSQGGHVAMATHKVMQRDYSSEFTVTAAGPMSGPYNLVGFGDVVTSPGGQVNAGATLFVPLLLTSYQKSYGNIYAAPSDAYQAPYAATAETLFPTDTTISQLIAEGKLPNDPTFTALFGTGGLLTDSFRAGYQTGNYRKALETNTLLGWTPARPVALCGGAQDPTVFWAVNSPVTQADFASRGVNVPAFDLESRASLPAGATGDLIYGAFQTRKAAAGANAQAQYHGTLVPPFCTALVRGFFLQVLASGQ
jgi:hypothetical protein